MHFSLVLDVLLNLIILGPQVLLKLIYKSCKQLLFIFRDAATARARAFYRELACLLCALRL